MAAGIDILEFSAVLDGEWDSLTLLTAMVSCNPHEKWQWWIEPVKGNVGKGDDGVMREVTFEDG